MDLEKSRKRKDSWPALHSNETKWRRRLNKVQTPRSVATQSTGVRAGGQGRLRYENFQHTTWSCCGFVVVVVCCHEKLLCFQKVHTAGSIHIKIQGTKLSQQSLVAQSGGGGTFSGLVLVTVLTEVMVSQVHVCISIQLCLYVKTHQREHFKHVAFCMLIIP